MNDKEVEKVDPDQLAAAKARHPSGKRKRPVLRLVTKAEPETLGSCGCVDYHMADCPLRTDR